MKKRAYSLVAGAGPIVDVDKGEVHVPELVVCDLDDEDVFMNGGGVVNDCLMSGHDAFVQIYGDRRVIEREAAINALPGFVMDGASKVVAFGVSGTGDFAYKVNRGFLNKENINGILSRVFGSTRPCMEQMSDSCSD